MMTRRRYTILGVCLTILVLWYVATAKESTRNSEFYRKTVAAIDRRRNEGPQAPGAAHKTFLKGGSIRPDEKQKPIDTSPIDAEDEILRQIDAQMGKTQDLVAEVEGLDRGLENSDAHALSGKTAADIELEKQILGARKREQEKLKEEVRNQLKHKEMERQHLLADGKYLNPNWVGAFEKERKAPSALGEDELEAAPDFDPYRDTKADKPHQAPAPVARKNEVEAAPNTDPFRDEAVAAPYQAPVPVGRAGAGSKEQRTKKSEQQGRKLVKEQEYLEPLDGEDGKQYVDSQDDSRSPQGKVEKLEGHESSDPGEGREENIRPGKQSPLKLADHDAVLDSKRGRDAPKPDTRAQVIKGADASDVRGEGYLAGRRAQDADHHDSRQQALVGQQAGEHVDDDAAALRNARGAAVKDQIRTEVKTTGTTAASVSKTTSSAQTTPSHYTRAELELSRLLAMSPIVIFSKTFCPYSKKAKRILTESFNIMPTPYIVELDKHEHGAELQRLLAEGTGRRTVPNIVIDGVSLGGGDDVEELWERGELRNTIKEMGGKRILSVMEIKQP